MNITINVTREDYWQLNKYVLWKKYKGTVYSYLFGTPILMFFIFLIINLPTTYSVVAAIVLGTLVNVCLYNCLKYGAKKVLSDKPGLLGGHIIDITEDGLSEKTSVNENFYKWEGIQSIEENNLYIFIFLDNILCHIVPKRDFTSQDEASQFVNMARAFYEPRSIV